MAVVDGRPQCPVHGNTMARSKQIVTSGLFKIVRKIMIVWHCKHDNCNVWCEEILDGFLWP
jgi:hypothetical protein